MWKRKWNRKVYKQKYWVISLRNFGNFAESKSRLVLLFVLFFFCSLSRFLRSFSRMNANLYFTAILKLSRSYELAKSEKNSQGGRSLLDSIVGMWFAFPSTFFSRICVCLGRREIVLTLRWICVCRRRILPARRQQQCEKCATSDARIKMIRCAVRVRMRGLGSVRHNTMEQSAPNRAHWMKKSPQLKVRFIEKIELWT